MSLIVQKRALSPLSSLLPMQTPATFFEQSSALPPKRLSKYAFSPKIPPNDPTQTKVGAPRLALQCPKMGWCLIAQKGFESANADACVLPKMNKKARSRDMLDTHFEQPPRGMRQFRLPGCCSPAMDNLCGRSQPKYHSTKQHGGCRPCMLLPYVMVSPWWAPRLSG